MTSNPPSLSSRLESVADRPLEISPRESLTRIFIRPWLFAICVLIPPLMALGLTSLIPTTYKASCKILIRYGASEDAFLRDLIPDNRAALSGMSSAEILRSMPSVVAAVKAVGITDADIAKSPKDVLSGYISRLLPKSTEDNSSLSHSSQVNSETLRVAESFKGSLADSSNATSSKAVEVLDKGIGALPAAERGDDLITMTVPSFNRLKVAAMANGLAQAFIAEYARLSADEAHRSVDFLDKLVADAQGTELGVRVPDSHMSGVEGRPSGDVYRQSPLLEHLANDLATREADLAQLSSMYSGDAAAVVNARAAVKGLRASLDAAELQEIQKLSLEQLRLRRYQAANTEHLFRAGLVPISIVEAAETPNKVSAVSRYIVSGGIGLILGLVLGLGLVTVLSVSDQRLHTSWDVQRALRLPLLAVIQELRKSEGGQKIFGQATSSTVEDEFIQLLGRLDLARRHKRGLALAVASASNAEGKTFVVSGLAAALARGGRHRVLLIDADLRSRSLSIAAGANEELGFIDAMLNGKPLTMAVRPTELTGVDILPAGHSSRRSELGFYRTAFERALTQVRDAYDFILVDTTAVLLGNEPMMCGASVDGILWIASAGTSRRPLLRTALGKLSEIGLRPIGVVLNRKREYLPSFIWRNV